MTTQPTHFLKNLRRGHSKTKINFIYLSLSFLISASAQPDWSVLSCLLASSVGYAFFWQSLSFFERKKNRFLAAMIWFGLVEGFHLNWFFADRYVGFYIYPFLILLLMGLGAQFGLISLMVGNIREMNIKKMLGISGGWTILEWSRLFLLSGFSWDPVGMALTGTDAGMQMASVFGIYGLSFWLIFTNLLSLKTLGLLRNLPLQNRSFFSTAPLCLAAILLPYIFGWAHIVYHQKAMTVNASSIKALLVQTSLIPEQRYAINGSKPLTPVEQWDHILALLIPSLDDDVQLIVLPEGAVPYGTDVPIYSKELVSQSFKKYYPSIDFFPFKSASRVGNRFWSQALANASNASIIIGLDDVDPTLSSASPAYNAAFLFSPQSLQADRYEKRVLVPMGEYIPFKWCKKILSKYGITDSFTPGLKAKVFDAGGVKAGVSICYEETYGNLMRESRRQGAQLLVNLTNDVWYPRSRLPVIHAAHGRLRAIETGIPLLRACNTGVTCGIDSLGRVVDQLPYDCRKTPSLPGVLCIDLPLYHFFTLYTFFGDLLVILISFIFLVLIFKNDIQKFIVRLKSI